MSLIQRVWECGRRSRAVSVVIATDDEQISAEAARFGAECVMTRPDHKSGSDRIAECVEKLRWPEDSLVVNLQGDEPQMPPECLDQVAQILADDPGADIASLYQVVTDADEIRSPDAVKVVVDGRGRALFFSRSVIPAPRGWESIEAAVQAGHAWKRHIGLYAYRVEALRRFARHEPTALERLERLEQLRVLESGGAIAMGEAAHPVPAGVDIPADLERVRLAFQ